MARRAAAKIRRDRHDRPSRWVGRRQSTEHGQRLPFAYLSELVAAGGVGMAYGTGAGGQTYITSDGDQLRNAVTTYFASPYALP